MTSSDERKELKGLARSIDALFGGERGRANIQDEEVGPADEPAAAGPAPGDVVAELRSPESLSEPPSVESESDARSVEPEAEVPSAESGSGLPSSEPEAETRSGEAAGATSGTDDLVWEPVPPAQGPAHQPKPDAAAFGAAIGRFLESDPLARDGQARGIREMAAALREAGSLDALADAVERLALEGGNSADEACIAMARALVSPGVASRITARLGAEREDERRAELLLVCRRVGHDMALAVSDALSAESTDRYARRALLDAMVAMGPAGMEVVERMMEDDRWFVVRNAVAILGEAGKDGAVELITTALAHADPRVRREALLALARIGGENAAMLVYGMIEDPDPDVRLAAATAAGELKVERALKPLLALLESESDDSVVEGVLHALGRLGDPSAVNTIEKKAVGSFFSRPSTDVRIAAYRALHNIGTPHAKSVLEAAADDKNPDVRAAVRQIVDSH